MNKTQKTYDIREKQSNSKPMSISSVNNCYVPSAIPALEPEVPVSGNVSESNALAQTDVKPLTFEERQQKMKESNMRYMFDQMIASQRRYTQDMQKQIREQQEEDARNGYSAF